MVQFFYGRVEKYSPEYSSFCTSGISAAAGNTQLSTFLGDIFDRTGRDSTD